MDVNIFVYVCGRFLKSYKNMETLTKRERFKKVAGNRVQRLLDTLALLSNCSNKNNYEYSVEDVKLMFTEIDRALRQTKEAYNSKLSKENNKFKFTD